MKLSDWHRLRQADDLPQDQGDYGHDYSGYGENPMAPRPLLSDPPPGESANEQHGDLVLIIKNDSKALVVDPRQHYLVITMQDKDWWEGARKDLGAIGREKALRLFDRS
jgi:hypothetical protein